VDRRREKKTGRNEGVKHGGYQGAGGWTCPCPDSHCARSLPRAPGRSAARGDAPTRAGCRRVTNPTWRRVLRAPRDTAGRAARAASTAAWGAAAHANARAVSRARAVGVCDAVAGDRARVRGRDEALGTGRACAGVTRPRRVAVAAAVRRPLAVSSAAGRKQARGGGGSGVVAGSESAKNASWRWLRARATEERVG